MSSLRLYFFLLAVALVQTAFADKGDKWRVTDQDLSVWSSPDYLEKLGTVHQGFEIEEIAMDGDMIQFDYNGQTAYVATYCCERVADEAVAPETDEVSADQPATAVRTASRATTSKKTQNGSLPKIELAERPDEGKKENVSADEAAILLLGMVVCLIGSVLGLVALVFTLFYVFKYKSLAAWFNKRCEAEAIPQKRMNKLLWPPVIAAFAMAILGVGINTVIAIVAAESESWQIPLFCLGILLTLAIPVFVLRHSYLKNKKEFGKKAARWMMLYSLLSLVAIYLCCLAIAYLVVGIVALLIIVFVICVCFPSRYYVIRRW